MLETPSQAAQQQQQQQPERASSPSPPPPQPASPWDSSADGGNLDTLASAPLARAQGLARSFAYDVFHSSARGTSATHRPPAPRLVVVSSEEERARREEEAKGQADEEGQRQRQQQQPPAGASAGSEAAEGAGQARRVFERPVNPYTGRPLKHCRTCLHDVPPRAHHCGDTEVCVHEFDHYCPWVGTVVGKRNHRYFFFFLAGVRARARLCVRPAPVCEVLSRGLLRAHA